MIRRYALFMPIALTAGPPDEQVDISSATFPAITIDSERKYTEMELHDMLPPILREAINACDWPISMVKVINFLIGQKGRVQDALDAIERRPEIFVRDQL